MTNRIIPHLVAWKSFIRHHLEECLNRCDAKSVLDIGVGDTTKLLLDRANTLAILDRAEVQTKKYQDVVQTFTEDIQSDDLDHLNERFDLVVCSEVLEHLEDPFKAARNVERMVKPNGTLFVSVPSFLEWHPMLPVCDDYWRFMSSSMKQLFSLENILLETYEPDENKFAPIGIIAVFRKT